MPESKKRTTKVVEKDPKITTVIETDEQIVERWNRPLRPIPAPPEIAPTPPEIAPTPQGGQDDGDKGDTGKGDTETGDGDKSSSDKKS